MTPIPLPEIEHAPETNNDQKNTYTYEQPMSGHEVVITGIAGKYPNSNNVQEFTENLFNKVDMVSDDDRRWKLDHPEIPQRTGKVNNMDKFDAQYFGVHYKQAWTMDPMCRQLLESTYAAVVDAGMSPRSLRNSKVGVFVGACFSESEKTWFYEKIQVNGFGITGCSRAMLANRLSYWLGTTGPSYTVDAACNSSLVALEHAYKAIRSGYCEAAVVGGSQLCLHPYISLLYSRMGFLSKDGKTRVFDENADGYARSETIGVLFLQKSKDAKRIFAQVVHAKSNVIGSSEHYLTYRDAKYQKQFYEEFYSEIDVKPHDVEYIEAYGTGIPRMDREELEAIDQVFCKDRTKPLYVGSVKSNAGHAEAASGIMSLTKACIAYQKGRIPPNLHYENAINIDSLKSGRMKVVTDTIPFNKGYIAINGYSYSGTNAHVLLKCLHREKKTNENENHAVPYVVLASGRTQDAVTRVLDGAGVTLDDVKDGVVNKNIDLEHISLLHSVYEYDVPGHIYRGYNIITHDGEKITSLGKSVEHFPGVKRPVWFVYSGMGSQWSGMAAQLMRIPIFAAAIEKCHKALAPKGVNLTEIITNPNPDMFDNILHSFIGIAAVQIGLTDILTAIDIKPDYIIGHSVGELGCAYADGCFTAEQMILAAYSRGRASVETPFIKGSMAAVGVGYNEIKGLCPSEIEVACHNGPDSCTISGPADIMKEFVSKLTAQGIFAKEVPCSNIAYHSRYIAEAGPVLLRYLREVIPTPRARSERWVSTSVPQSDWSQDSAKNSSAEYHTNNLLSPVLFEETSRLIPGNAITIEIAPHGLLQAILRRSLKKDCTNIPLTKRGHPDNVQFLLNALGKLYEVGMNPKMKNIYPTVELPVTANTPYISNLVEWEHSENWYACTYEPLVMVKSGERSFMMTLYDRDYKFMAGHIVNGVNCFPATGHLVLVWDTLARMVGVPYNQLSVIFEEVNFEGDTVISKDKPYKLTVMIQKTTGNFEIIHDGVNIVNGRIKREKSKNIPLKELPDISSHGTSDIVMNSDDVYRVLSLKGYSYSGSFKSINSYRPDTSTAQVYWENNWTTYLDSLVQLSYVQDDSDTLSRPKYIQNLNINVKKHNDVLSSVTGDDKTLLNVAMIKEYNSIRSGGVELTRLRTVEVPHTRIQGQLSIDKYQFIPHFGYKIRFERDIYSLQSQIILQNQSTNHIRIVEIVDNSKDITSRHFIDALNNNPGATSDLLYVNDNSSMEDKLLAGVNDMDGVSLFIGKSLLGRNKIMNQIYALLRPDGFILTREQFVPKENTKLEKYHIVSICVLDNSFVLLKKKAVRNDVRYLKVKADESFSWIEEFQKSVADGKSTVLVSEQDPMGGVLGLIKRATKESSSPVSSVVVTDYRAPAFDSELQMYKEQLNKNLTINVFYEGKWGGYYRLPTNINKINTVYTQLVSRELGDLNTLEWREGDPKHLNNSDVLVHVYNAGVTYFDVQKASGRINTACIEQYNKTDGYGMEYAGRLSSNGSRVMGLVLNGSLTSILCPYYELIWEIPSIWSMEDAATVPVAYLNAFYCLYCRGDLKPGMKILVHNGTGALGQAVINICLANKCEVFTTVSSDEKKQFLLKNYPQINVRNIGSSLDTSFEDMISIGTHGVGCEIVISSMTGELREASARSVAFFGVFIDLNRSDAFDNEPFGMYFLLKHRNYLFASMSNIFNDGEHQTRRKLSELMSKGIESGYVKPLYRTTFKYNETYKAFKYISSRKHIGKVVIQMRDEEKSLKAPPKLQMYEAVPSCVCPPDKSYIVISYGSQYYIEVIDYLVKCGSRNILLHTDADINNNGYIKYRMRSWVDHGAKVEISNLDIKTEMGCKQLIADAIKLAPVHGLYFLNTKIQKKMFLDSYPEDFRQSFMERAVPFARFDGLTKIMCPQLREFVIFTDMESSNVGAVTSLVDNIVEGICQGRRKLGLPATGLQVGPISVADVTRKSQNMESLSQPISDILNILTMATKSEHSVISCHVPKRVHMDSNIVDMFESVIGDRLICDSSDEMKLSDVGYMDLNVAKEIASMLSRRCSLYYSPRKILNMTVKELKSLSDTMRSNRNNEPSKGVAVFFKKVDPEEFTATETITRMGTQVGDITETEDQFSYDDTYLWLLPGLDGNRFIYNTICESLKTKAFSFQLGLDYPEETLRDTAERLYQIMKKRLRSNTEFYLFAYSYGVSVALELATLLERDGFVGKIFCLDGGPDYFKLILNKYLGHLTEAELQNELIKHYWKLLECETNTKLDTILTNDTNWNEKINKCTNLFKSSTNFSKQYQCSVINMPYKRIIQARNYTAQHLKPLKSELIVIKANNKLDISYPNDLDLSRYSLKPVKVYEIDSPHGSATHDLQCSSIINSELNIDETFKKLNNCRAYNIDINALC